MRMALLDLTSGDREIFESKGMDELSRIVGSPHV